VCEGGILLTIRARFCVVALITTIATTALPADDPIASGPITLGGLRLLSADNAEFSRCTSGQLPERCWICKDGVCGHTERLAYGGWSVSSSAFVSTDGESLDCEVAAQSIRISFNHLYDPPQVTFQVPGRKFITLHEARPVHLFISGERFTNPADGPYLKMDFQNNDGSIADRHALVDKMRSAYRITVEGWNVDDEKVSTVDLGEGLANAIEHCNRFAEKAVAHDE